MKRRPYLLVLATLVPLAALAEPVPSAEDVLRRSIGRHDPGGEWAYGSYRLVLRETRPNGTSRDTTVLIDNRAGRFDLTSHRDENIVAGSLQGGTCSWLFNGSPSFSDEVRAEYRLTCDRLERTRNYYSYLWGLPMKLRDPGTLLGAVEEGEFEGREALSLRVTYEEDVGKDVWYVYFDPASYDMLGYRFYHDEAANDGEYILLSGMEEGAGLRLPKTRTWYTHKEDKLLGTDSLISIERP